MSTNVQTRIKLHADIKKPVQDNFLGIGAVYHGYAGMPDKDGRVYTEEQCELEADRAADLGFKLARTYYRWYAYENGEWNWESERMQVFCKWVERLYKRGIDIELNVGWVFPGDIDGRCGWNLPTPFAVENDWLASVENYAKWVSESVYYLVKVKGYTNIKYLVMFTEPGTNAAYKNFYPEGRTFYEAYAEAVRAVDRHLKERNIRDLVKLMGPNEGATSTAEMMIWTTEHLNDCIDVYSSHNYIWTTEMPASYARSGHGAFIAKIRGGKCQQKVVLEPHTDYKMSAWMKLYSEDYLHVSGNMLMGVFEYQGENKFFSGGGQPTSRMTQDSTCLIDASQLCGEWRQFSFTFNSGDNHVAWAGVMFDVNSEGSIGAVDDIELCRCDDGKNILINGDFEESSCWVDKCCALSIDPYYDWQRWAKVAISRVPEGKQYIVDEFNCLVCGAPLLYSDPRHAVRMASSHLALMNAGVHSLNRWTAFDQQWPNNHTNKPEDEFYDGDHRYGVMPVLTRSLVPKPAYYEYRLLCKYSGGAGTKVYDGGGTVGVHMTICELPDGNWSIFVTNLNEYGVTFDISLNDAINRQFKKFMYESDKIVPEANIEQLPCLDTPFITNVHTDEIPPYSFIAYTTME